MPCRGVACCRAWRGMACGDVWCVVNVSGMVARAAAAARAGGEGGGAAVAREAVAREAEARAVAAAEASGGGECSRGSKGRNDACQGRQSN